MGEGEAADELNRDEVIASIHGVVAEVRAALGTASWALVPREGTVAPMHAAAGLSHCCHLAEEIIMAHERGAEMVARTLARSLFEIWLHAYYLQLGGIDAFKAVTAAHGGQLQKQQDALKKHDDEVKQRRRDVRKRNNAIVKKNAELEAWNQRHPDNPKPLLNLIPDPPGVVVDFGPPSGIAYMVEPEALPLSVIVERLGTLTRDAGREETFGAGYNLVYRGLSNLGAHTNLFVLDSYLDDGGGKAFTVKIREQAVVSSSFEMPNLLMALLLTATLAAAVLEPRGSKCERSQAAVDRILEVYGRRSTS